MSALKWTELFSEDPSIDFTRLLSLWPATVKGALRPIGMSAFGDVYFERPGGTVERLDVLEGGVNHVAATVEAFKELMNTPSWQEQHLLSQGIALLLARGLSRGPNECFAFAPHPVFVGKVDFGLAMVMGAFSWHSVCSQLLDTAPPSTAIGT